MNMNLICSNNNVTQNKECLKLIDNASPENPMIIIVPDQFSYSAEKLVANHLGGSGLNGVEVITFSRLTSRLIERAKQNYLTGPGKTILIQQAVANICNDENNIYSGSAEKHGFALETEKIISEFKRYMITPEILSSVAEKLPDGMFRKKINSLNQIYSYYILKTENKFHDSDDDLIIVANKIISENLFSDTHVIFYEFSDFFPGHFKVIDALLKSAKELTVILPTDESDEELLEIPQKTKNQLISLGNKNSVKINIINPENNEKQFNSSEIEFYKQNFSSYYKHGFCKWKKETEDISIYVSKDPYKEVERAARQIKTLIETQGYRYSDIALVYGSADDYNHIIQSVFTDYDIPYFTDSKIPATEHPVITALLGVFDIIDNNWSYDSVFGYLKSGFVYKKTGKTLKQISADDIDMLDSYVLKRGIRGKKKWLDKNDWEYKRGGISDFENSDNKNNLKAEKLNKIRRIITEPISVFINKISGRKTVYEICEAFYEYLCDICLYEGLQDKISRLNTQGRRNEAEQFSLVWNMLIEVLNQLVVTIGDEKCSKKEFANYLYAGLSSCSMGIIPSSLDSVTIGSADSVRQKQVRALFVIGCIRGVIPLEINSEGIISDKERIILNEILSSDDAEIGNDSKTLKNVSWYRFYRVLFTATDKLYLSYPVNSFEGDSFIPSQFIYDIEKIFDNIKTINGLSDDNHEDELINSPKSAFNYLMENRNNKNINEINDLKEWFSQKEEWKDKIRIIQNADKYKAEQLKINSKHTKDLYSRYNGYSVSRINDFSYCPYKYFLKYGLRAKEQEVWKIQKFDLGSLMHLVICKYCQEVENGAKSFEELKNNWNRLTRSESEEIIDKIINEIKDKIIITLDRDEAKFKYLIERMTKTIKRSIETVRISLNNGAYVAAEHEKEFCIDLSDGEDAVSLVGTIDRIDVAKIEGDDNAKIRIIDYKSGAKKFSVVSISNMLDIQLVVYASCAAHLYKNGDIRYLEETSTANICGIMYNKIRDDMESIDADMLKNVDEITTKALKLDGIVILDKSDTESEMCDPENAFLMDYKISDEGESEYLKFKLTSKGEIAKTSTYTSREEFDRIVKYVERKIINIDKQIKDGNIAVCPSEDNNSKACIFCEMAEICLFDENRDKTRKLINNSEDAWSEIIKETD